MNKSAVCRLDLKGIESALRAVQAEFPRINRQLNTHREHMADEVVENMVAGYGFVDAALTDGSDLLALGNSKQLLELNTLVLCGQDPKKRDQYRAHLEATERLFYDQREGGIGDFHDWYVLHRNESLWRLAAGVYIRILSRPQLYIEGNHRTGALLMSYILMRQGQPPFVLTVDNAKVYFKLSMLITHTKKHGMPTLFRLPRLKKNLARFLQERTDEKHLLRKNGAPLSMTYEGLGGT